MVVAKVVLALVVLNRTLSSSTYSQFCVFNDLDPAVFADGAPKEDLAYEFGVPCVRDVVLSDVAMEPVAEVQEPVIKGDQDVCDET